MVPWSRLSHTSEAGITRVPPPVRSKKSANLSRAPRPERAGIASGTRSSCFETSFPVDEEPGGFAFARAGPAYREHNAATATACPRTCPIDFDILEPPRTCDVDSLNYRHAFPGGRQCIQAKCKSIPRARGRRQIDPLQRTDPACLISLPACWSFSADPKRRQCTRLDCAARDSLQVPPRNNALQARL